MKKRTLALLVCMALVLTAVFALVACDNTVKHTVTFYNGTKKINEVEIEDGKTIDATYKPEQDGKTFVAWYEDVSLAGDAFDVDTPIKSDLKLFGKWQSNTVEADTRKWYIIGNYDGTNSQWDAPTTKDEATGEWSIVEGKESRILAKEDGVNVFKISVTLRPNMKFRFATNILNDSDWTGDEGKAEVGLGNMVGFAYAAGVNPEGNSEVTAESKEYGCVKKGDDVIFEGGKEFNANPKQWNIFLAEGQDGVYEFTITTYPGEDDRNTLEWKCTEKLEPLSRTCKLVLAGTMNEWDGSDDNGYVMSEVKVNEKGEGIYKYALTVDTIGTTPDGATEAISKVEFKVVNVVSSAWWGPLADGKVGDTGFGPGFVIEENGTYLIEVDTVNKTYKFEKAAIRIAGTIDGQGWADGSQRSEGYKHNMYVMNKVESATEGVEKYELVLEITEKHAASWLKGKAAAIKVECNAAGYEIWGCGEGVNGKSNIELDTVGVYKVTFELSYNEAKERQTNVTVTKLADADIPVAMIGATEYDTLVDAVAAAKDGDTIVVYKDITSGGISIKEGRNIAIAIVLNGHTLTMGTPLVGSEGTVSQSMHFEKGNAVAIMDGTITCLNNSASMLVQNYCDLTLDNVTLDGRNLVGNGTAYTLSNNFGTIVIKNGSKIIARTEKGVAFDLWYGMNGQGAYDEGISVTVEKGCTITGAIEYGAASRITGTDWVEKVVLTLPAGEYTINYTSEGLTDEIANITIAPAETPAE